MNRNLHLVARKLICLCAMLMKFMEIVNQGPSQGGSSSARLFDLACPGIAKSLC